jgi:putative ATPase
MSAVISSVGEVKEIIQKAKSTKETLKKQTILFMDEIHRFNKLQQDTFLPHIESGNIILLGATTENPSFSLNNALLSRCRVVVLEKLKSTDIMSILRRALPTFETVEIPKNLTHIPDDFADKLSYIPKITITEDCLKWIADSSDGDARIALSSLEMCLKQATNECEGEIKTIDLESVKDNIKRTHFLYDRAGDQHYDCISALHKSIRASDDNASLYWCMRMLKAGEDPRFICRRLIRAASEDIGLADPNALMLATSTMHSVEKVGMPESDCIVAQLAIYLARAPKSTESYFAMLKCKEHLKNHQGPLPEVPLHLRNAPTKLMQQWGYGKSYNRLHKDESNLNYLPEEIGDVNFFEDE